MYIQLQNFGYNSSIKSTYHEGKYECIERIHQFPEIVYIIDGSVDITVDGIRETAKAGDIAVIPPFKMHSFYTPNYVKQLICVFSNSFITDFISLDELCKSREAFVFHASAPIWSYLMDIDFYNTKTKLKFDPAKDAPYIHKLRSIFYLIIAEYFNTVKEISSSATDNTLSKILIYMSQNYTDNLTLASVGAALGYSPKYISNCLSMIPGIGFRDLINSMRIDKAKLMLVNTSLSVLDIACECGFSSLATFHRTFSNLVGTSPKKHRIKHKNELKNH